MIHLFALILQIRVFYGNQNDPCKKTPVPWHRVHGPRCCLYMPQPESRGDFVPQNAVKIYETVDGSEILKKNTSMKPNEKWDTRMSQELSRWLVHGVHGL